MNYKAFLFYFIGLIFTLVLLIFPYLVFDSEVSRQNSQLRVMTYSSFIQKWGAGPEIAKRFEEETGITIHWINAGNAGLLLERLKFKRETDRPDMVIGFDQFSIHEARQSFQWHDLHTFADQIHIDRLPKGARFYDFLAYDWGPLSFVYRQGQAQPPTSIDELLGGQFKQQLILQDPRMSSPGLQFLIWVLTLYGEEKGFEYLEKLAPSIKVMAPSWSSSYSLFKVDQPSLVFSYFTSPFYHSIEEKDDSYKAVHFQQPHPIQVEYAGIPKFCVNCVEAKQLAAFLMRPDIQKILM